MTEKEFQSRVIYEAELAGWKVYHTYDSRRSQRGYPDLTMVRAPRVIFAELKTEGGRVTETQKQWLDAFGQTPVETYLWRPSDTDAILAVLE